MHSLPLSQGLQHYAHSLPHFSQWLQNHQWGMMLVRYPIMVAIIMYYPRWIQKQGEKHQADAAVIQRYAKYRYPVGFFLLVELLIVHHGFAALIQWIQGVVG